MKLTSVIIPSRNEQPYLENTINNVLANGANVEVLAVLDGWNPDINISDKRVKFISNEDSIGQRPSINKAAREAQGDYIFKLDAHCAVGKEFDAILQECDYKDTIIPAMMNLDVETWEPRFKDDWDTALRKGKLNPYMYIGWKEGRLRTLYYGSTDRKRLYNERKHIPIDETMSCMGPGFFMHHDRFFETGGCDEGHGHWGQQGIEVACKAWLSGGRLLTNKNTWFAHFFRGGGVPEGHKSGFPYRLSQRQVNKARDYSEDLWLNNKWHLQKHTMEWLVDKFNPPTWEGYFTGMMLKEKNIANRDDLIKLFAEKGFKKGAEIGVAEGRFSDFMHQTIPDLTLLSVDAYVPSNGISSRRRKKQFVRAKRRLSKYLNNTMIVDSSMNALQKVPDESLDFVYIDADHKFNGVVCDIVEWSKKVRKGGIVSGHDYICRGNYGVVDAVDMYVRHNKKELFLTKNDGRGGHSWFFYK